MSQADLDTLRVGYEAFNRGQWDAAARLAHPDFRGARKPSKPLAYGSRALVAAIALPTPG
jgi:hypothetical protein